MTFHDFGIDPDKAITLFSYTVNAFKITREEAESRRKLAHDLSRLKELKLDKRVHVAVDLVEQHLDELYRQESDLLKAQREHINKLASVKEKIDKLDDKLKKFSIAASKRKKNVNKMQKDMKTILSHKEIGILEGRLEALEIVHNQLKANGMAKEKLKDVEKRIRQVKKKIKNMKA